MSIDSWRLASVADQLPTAEATALESTSAVSATKTQCGIAHVAGEAASLLL